MPFRRYKVDPSRKQGVIKVALKLSPTLSLKNENEELVVSVVVTFHDQTDQSRPMTLCTDLSIFDVYDEDHGGVDMFARGAFGLLRSTTGLATRNISLGLLRLNERDSSDATDLRERGCRFITIPADGTPIMFEHKLSWARVFEREGKRSKSDLMPGEQFEMKINSQYFGTRWWCWGDLDGDLKGKKLHQWRPPYDERPDENLVKNGDWVLGEEPMTLEWEDVTDDSAAKFTIVD